MRKLGQILNHIREKAMPFHSALGSAFHAHFVLNVDRYVFPFTHHDKSYDVVNNIKISDYDIVGKLKTQYMCPIPHEWDARFYDLESSKQMVMFYRKHFKEINNAVQPALEGRVLSMPLILQYDEYLRMREARWLMQNQLALIK